MSKRCYNVAVTWEPAAKCDVKTITVRPGDNLEDTPESVCAFIKTLHHRRGGKYYYPVTAEIVYEVDPESLPKPITETMRKPEPLSAPPKPLNKDKK
jgi:hypothetical protein